nr:hypothetical protein [Rhodococcus sp. HNM0569]
MLVPELAGVDGDIAALRRAVGGVARTLGERTRTWTVVAVGDRRQVLRPPHGGTFAGYGADVRVELGTHSDGEVDPHVPLPALIAGWIRGTYAPHVDLDVHVVPADWTGARAAEFGRSLRDTLTGDDGILVVADGARTLTPRAPGAFDDRAPALQETVDAALTSGDREALAALPAGTCAEIGMDGRVPWQVLAGAFATRSAPVAKTEYCAAPFGVGYHVGSWWP